MFLLLAKLRRRQWGRLVISAVQQNHLSFALSKISLFHFRSFKTRQKRRHRWIAIIRFKTGRKPHNFVRNKGRAANWRFRPFVSGLPFPVRMNCLRSSCYSLCKIKRLLFSLSLDIPFISRNDKLTNCSIPHRRDHLVKIWHSEEQSKLF